MKIHVLQHVPFEGIGSIAAWLETREASVSYTRFYRDDQLPPPDSIDMVIVMGGPMSVNDEDKLPWLKPEKQFIRDAIASDIPVLGLCLGAQLIANALGAPVYPNRVKEIGWFPVQAVGASEGSFRFPQEFLTFHWHGETFDLPDNAVHLARSSNCANQAFQLKQNVIGLQFHLETTREGALAMVENCGNELVPGPGIQSKGELLAVPGGAYQAINLLMSDVLAYLVRVNDGDR
jgi:GMP synthase-like glutamine amidotransferase